MDATYRMLYEDCGPGDIWVKYYELIMNRSGRELQDAMRILGRLLEPFFSDNYQRIISDDNILKIIGEKNTVVYIVSGNDLFSRIMENIMMRMMSNVPMILQQKDETMPQAQILVYENKKAADYIRKITANKKPAEAG